MTDNGKRQPYTMALAFAAMLLSVAAVWMFLFHDPWPDRLISTITLGDPLPSKLAATAPAVDIKSPSYDRIHAMYSRGQILIVGLKGGRVAAFMSKTHGAERTRDQIQMNQYRFDRSESDKAREYFQSDPRMREQMMELMRAYLASHRAFVNRLEIEEEGWFGVGVEGYTNTLAELLLMLNRAGDAEPRFDSVMPIDVRPLLESRNGG